MKNKFRVIITLLFLSLLITGASSREDDIKNKQNLTWKFAVISDTQGNNKKKKNISCINDAILNTIAGDIVTERPDLVLVSGDLVSGWFKNGGTDFATQYKNWKRAMKPVYNMKIKIYAIRGNHDSGPERLALPPLPPRLEPKPGALDLLEREFKNAMIESYTPMNGPEKEKGLTYSFVYKNAFFIGLDQYTDAQHKINQKWFERQLSENRQPHLFVFGHEPAFEIIHKDNLSFYPEKRDLFWDSIGRAGGKIYFCGHEHLYNRALIQDSNGNSIWQIISSTGGGELRKWSGTYKEKSRVKCEYNNNDYHGYMLVTVQGSKVKVEWKALINPSASEWQILDTFNYTVEPVLTQ